MEIKVIYNFVYFDHLKDWHDTDCIRATLAKDDEKIISHISNFRPVKRIRDIITTFEKVQQKIRVKLILVGEGPEKEAAVMYAKELGIKDKILFLGNSHEIKKILCYSDLFLLPSQTESFGLAALEAMASRTPVISTNTGGLPEVNVQGVTGFLSDVGDCDEMAKNAIYILEDEQRLENFKENAYRQAQRFSIEKILPQYEEVYTTALSGIQAVI